tara:strand:+ start:3607 stop:3807 length:201 start_codon:yes stop_codon:yes gene_type:complete
MSSFRIGNIIDDAFAKGKAGLVMEDNPNNPFRLHRFKKKHNTSATGKKVNGEYKIVFWDNIKKGDV